MSDLRIKHVHELTPFLSSLTFLPDGLVRLHRVQEKNLTVWYVAASLTGGRVLRMVGDVGCGWSNRMSVLDVNGALTPLLHEDRKVVGRILNRHLAWQ